MNKNNLINLYTNPQPVPSVFNEGFSQYESIAYLINITNNLITNQNLGADEIEDLKGKKVELETYLNDLQATNDYLTNLDAVKVSKDELKNTRKLDETGNFTGSWFGIEKPVQVQGGVDALVLKLQSDLGDLSQLETEDKTKIINAINEVLEKLNTNVGTINSQLNDIAHYRNVLNYCVKNDGSDTETALNSLEPNYTYVFPSGIYGVKGFNNDDWHEGFKPKDNTKYIFLPGAKIKIIPNSSKIYAGIYLRNVKNVEIINPVIEGDRNEHTYSVEGSTHEWGHGIFIEGGTTCKIINPFCYDTTGDGIDIICYANSDVKIIDGKSDNVRRNGLSIESVDKLFVDNYQSNHANGTLPESGIDIEPWSSDCILNDVTLRNCKLENNADQGLIITKLDLVPSYDIKIEDCTLDGLTFGQNISPNSKGKIIVSNPKIIGGRMGILNYGNPNAKIINPIIEIATEKINFGIIPSPIYFQHDNTDTYNVLGELDIINAEIMNDFSSGLYPVYFQSTGGTPNIKNVNISFLRNNTNRAVSTGNIANYENCNIGYLPNTKYDFDGDITLGMLQLSKTTITNSGATEPTYCYIYNDYHKTNIFELEIQIASAQQFMIVAGADCLIYPFNTHNVYSSSVGSILKLKYKNGNFYATNVVGNWTPY
jgi:hypothetical protein